MKNKSIRGIFWLSIFINSLSFFQPVYAQENATKLGLPGDNLNLAVVLDVFQQSKTLEIFEKALNSDSLKINNLDLNNDGQTDYIKVIDNVNGNTHTIVLQDDLGKGETQDVAVIYVEKNGDDVKIQMMGDEQLYGKNYIIEPVTEGSVKETTNPGYKGGGTTIVNNTTNNYYNTQRSYSPPPALWYIVNHLYAPGYSVWVSPFYWGYYPGWYRPWRPYYWDDYYYHWYYQNGWNGWWYRPAPVFLFHNHYQHVYYGNRRTSEMVNRNRIKGEYNRTYNNPRQEIRRNDAKPNFPPLENHSDVRPQQGNNLTPVKSAKDVRQPDRNPSPKDVRPNKNADHKESIPEKSRKDRQVNPSAPPSRENGGGKPPMQQHQVPEKQNKGNTTKPMKKANHFAPSDKRSGIQEPANYKSRTGRR
jgi:hypothetical protein